jgi:hypothetical protein
VDVEDDGNAGVCSPYGLPYNNDECFADTDAGLLFPVTFSLSGNTYTTCAAGSTEFVGVGDTIYWGSNLDIYVTNLSQETTFINILIDWNRDGMWFNDPATSVNGNFIPEHCLVNFPVPPGFTGPLSLLTPPPIYAGPKGGHIWARFSITDVPVGQVDNAVDPGWDGSGEFLIGETEDYLFFVHPIIPLSNWALAIGIFLIAAFTFIRMRKS